MSDEDTSRERVREALRQGRLPNRRPDKMWGGPGGGVVCGVCGELISREEMGFDLEFAGGEEGSAVSHQMHTRCFAVWELERDRFQINQLRRSAKAVNGQGRPEGDSSASETGRFDVAKLRAFAAGGTIPEHEYERLDAGKSE